jgi:DNA mismatch repair protein MutS
VTLFRSIDAAVTPMGKRLLRAWLLRPSLDLAEINARLDAVEAGVKETVAREELRRALDGVLDLERLLSRVTLGDRESAGCIGSGCVARKDSGNQGCGVAISGGTAENLAWIARRTRRPARPHRATIVPEPPLSFADGGVIAAGVDRDLDELRELSRNSKQVLAQIEHRERGRTGISSLKVKFNSIFGYYIEVSKPNLHLVPQDYERKQTLVGAERFTTPELKEYETKILDAQEKIVEIERRLFTELRTAIAAEAKRIRQTALALAEVDVLASLAHIAALRNYCRPQILASGDGNAAISKSSRAAIP